MLKTPQEVKELSHKLIKNCDLIQSTENMLNGLKTANTQICDRIIDAFFTVQYEKGIMYKKNEQLNDFVKENKIEVINTSYEKIEKYSTLVQYENDKTKLLKFFAFGGLMENVTIKDLFVDGKYITMIYTINSISDVDSILKTKTARVPFEYFIEIYNSEKEAKMNYKKCGHHVIKYKNVI